MQTERLPPPATQQGTPTGLTHSRAIEFRRILAVQPGQTAQQIADAAGMGRNDAYRVLARFFDREKTEQGALVYFIGDQTPEEPSGKKPWWEFLNDLMAEDASNENSSN